jgi:nitrate/nitrite transporter NarK
MDTRQARQTALPRIYFGWYIVAAGAVANGMSVTLQGYANGVFFVPMSDDLGWSRTEFALAVTVGAFVTAATAAVFGGIIDRFGGRALAFAGTLLAAASLVAISELTELWQWYVLRAGVLSVGAALAGTLVVHTVLSKWFEIRRGRAIGIAALGLSLAGVLTPNLLTPFVDAEGWRAGWQVLAVATLLLLLPAAMLFRRQPEDMGLLPDGRHPGAPPARDRRGALLVEARSLTRSEAVRTSSMWLLIVAFGLAGLSFLALGTLTIPILTDSGFDRTTAAAMLSLFALPGLLTRIGWGFAAERVHARYLAAIAFACLAAGIVVIVPGTRAVSTPLVAVGFLVFGTGIAGLIPMQELVWASFFGRRHIGAVRGIGMPFQLGISASGPLIVSNYFDRVGDYTGVLLALGALAIVGIAIVLLAPDPQTRLPAATAAAAPPARATLPMVSPAALPRSAVEQLLASPPLRVGPPRGARPPREQLCRWLPLLVGSAIVVWLMALLVPAIVGSRRRR